MKNTTDNKIRIHEYDQREVQFTVRLLLVLNGGGIVALFGFLGQTWNTIPNIRRSILISIALMVIGLVFITLSSIIRLRSMHWHLMGKYPKNRLLRIFYHHILYIHLRTLSFLLFCSAVFYLIIKIYSFT